MTKSLDGRWGKSATNSAADCITAFNEGYHKQGADLLFIRRLRDQLPELDIAFIIDVIQETCALCLDDVPSGNSDLCAACYSALPTPDTAP